MNLKGIKMEELENTMPTTNTSNVDNPQGFLTTKSKPIVRKKITDFMNYINFDEWLSNQEKIK